ncbi:MAG: hypothetical protein IPL63_02750 [Saprospiraceae bacterium]|nr:hypothetical protein [Saprospiraceae bacterium]MBK8081576.1 hypothetical protein [Saprospiraceae bacterium]MBK8546328.1 hypothetical protein [Saprospiraceae bacterium]MBK8854366.1 hypothetical protein [Saprospiraceae bacterium]
MNDAHLHLVFNHFPIIVPIVGLLILVVGLVIKSNSVIRTAFGVFVLGAIMTFPAMYTGEGAEEIAEKLPGVTDALIETHEEKAETLAIVNYLLGFVSLIGIWASWKQKSFAKTIAIGVLILGLAGLYFGKMTGTSGGEIRHTEIRAGFGGNQSLTPENNSGEQNDD